MTQETIFAKCMLTLRTEYNSVPFFGDGHADCALRRLGFVNWFYLESFLFEVWYLSQLLLWLPKFSWLWLWVIFFNLKNFSSKECLSFLHRWFLLFCLFLLLFYKKSFQSLFFRFFFSFFSISFFLFQLFFFLLSYIDKLTQALCPPLFFI